MGLLYRNSVLWAGKVGSARKVLVKFDLPEPKVNQWSQAWWLAYYSSLRSSYRQMPGAPWPVSLAYLSELQAKKKPFSKNKNKKTKVGDIWEMIIETGLWLLHACAHLWTHTDICVCIGHTWKTVGFVSLISWESTESSILVLCPLKLVFHEPDVFTFGPGNCLLGYTASLPHLCFTWHCTSVLKHWTAQLRNIITQKCFPGRPLKLE